MASRGVADVGPPIAYLEHAVQDGRTTQPGGRRLVSRRFELVELTDDGQAREAG